MVSINPIMIEKEIAEFEKEKESEQSSGVS
jgi:hypothetical protein